MTIILEYFARKSTLIRKLVTVMTRLNKVLFGQEGANYTKKLFALNYIQFIYYSVILLRKKDTFNHFFKNKQKLQSVQQCSSF